MNITSTINVDGSTDTGSGIQSQKSLGLASWEEILKESMSGSATVSSHAPSSSSQTIPSGVVFEQENTVLSELLGGESVSKQQFSIPVSAQPHWQVLYFFFFLGQRQVLYVCFALFYVTCWHLDMQCDSAFIS